MGYLQNKIQTPKREEIAPQKDTRKWNNGRQLVILNLLEWQQFWAVNLMISAEKVEEPANVHKF